MFSICKVLIPGVPKRLSGSSYTTLLGSIAIAMTKLPILPDSLNMVGISKVSFVMIPGLLLTKNQKEKNPYAKMSDVNSKDAVKKWHKPRPLLTSK